MNLEDTCYQVCTLAREVGDFIRREKDKLRKEDIKTKGLHNYVTYVDKQSEQALTKELLKILPEAGFIVEEGTIEKKGDRFNWIIDPLDGTTNFIHSIPVFSISIALTDNNEIVIGVIYDVIQDECFYTWKGAGAFMNNEPIQVSDAEKLNNSLLATGFPYAGFDKMNDYLMLIKDLLDNSHGIRRFGSAAIDLCYVASGRLEGFYEYGLNPWDVAAGALIVKNSGGIITDFKGGANYLFGNEIIASNRKIYDEFFNIIQKYFG